MTTVRTVAGLHVGAYLVACVAVTLEGTRRVHTDLRTTAIVHSTLVHFWIRLAEQLFKLLVLKTRHTL